MSIALAGEAGVAAPEAWFPPGDSPTDDACQEQLAWTFAPALEHDLVVHLPASRGAASDIDTIR